MSKTSNKLGIKTYKLTEEDGYVLDKLASLAKNDPEQKKKIAALEAYLKIIPDVKGREYAFSKFLNNDPYYSKFKQKEDLNPNIAKYWDPVDDYVPPDVAKLQEKEDTKKFWDWNSNKHWSKRTQGELERRAQKMGYSDVNAFMDDVKKEQQLKDYDASLDAGDHVVNFFFPRTAEAIREGKYNDRDDIKKATDLLSDKNFLMDMGENAMYSVDPLGRVVRGVATKGAEKLVSDGGKKALNYGSKIVANAMNPLAMEAADAAAYSGDEDNDRSKFSGIDVLFGTGINTGMEGILSRVPATKNIAHNEKPKTRQTKDSAELEEEWLRKVDAQDKKVSNARELVEDLERSQLSTPEEKAMAKHRYDVEAEKLENKIFKEMPLTFVEDPSLGELAKYQAANLGADALSLGSNKLGDMASEDPRMAKRILRYGFHVPMAGPFLNAAAEAYYNRDSENKAKKKIDSLLGLED